MPEKFFLPFQGLPLTIPSQYALIYNMTIEQTNTFSDMSFEDFLHWLPYIDWYYNMADDGAAYRAGKKQVEDDRKLAESNGPKWVEAYEAEQKNNPYPTK